MIRNIDSWIGKTLFHPIIIAICQMLDWTQYRFAAVVRFAAFAILFFLYRDYGTVVILYFGVMTFASMMLLAFAPEMEAKESFGFRLYFFGLTALILWAYAIEARNGLLPLIVMAMGGIIREYSLTIKTIPPREQEFTVKAENR